jgi:broad specificity phosphatase PhoE
LQEIHAGIFQKLRWDEIAIAHPADAARWKAHEPDFVIPGGESRRQLMSRGEAALRDIRAQPFAHVAVIAHGGILTAALKALLGIPAERNPFRLFNASISVLEWNDEPKLLTLNQIGHLCDLDDGVDLHSGDL